MNKNITRIIIASMILLVIPMLVDASLSCNVTTNCEYADIFHISDLTNAHAELNNNSDYGYEVCCRDTNNITIGAGCTYPAATLLHLSDETNAHAELTNESGYSYNACLNTTEGSISVAYAESCTGYDTCVASLSTDIIGKSTDLHVADCITDSYATKICARLTTKGVISTETNATPFYTTSSNPQNASNTSCLANMKGGDSCNVTWSIVPTGTIYTTWDFFAIFNAVSYRDNVATQQSGEVNITITGDVAPTVSTPVINPSTAYTNDSLDCSWIITDPDTQNVTANVTWYKDGVKNITESVNCTAGVVCNTTNDILPSFTLKGEVWNCSVFAYDNSSLSATKHVVVTIQNSPPTTPIVYYPADGVRYGSIPYINYSSTDADGDSITYYVYANSTLNITTTTNVTSWNASDGDYELIVRAYDGSDYSGNSVTVEFMLDSTAATVSIIYPSDGSNISSNSIYLNASAYDNLAASLTYYWIINGSLNSTTMDSNSTFNASDGYYNLTLFVSDGLQNGSDTAYFRLDTVAPSFSNNETNASLMKINENATFNITVSDNIGLSYYIFSWNGTGRWENNTNGSIYGESVKLIVNKSTNLSYGNSVGYVWYANDSAGNWNNSLLWTFDVADTAPTTPIIIYPLAQAYSNVPYLNYSASDADGDSLAYYVYINGSLNISGISGNVTGWNAGDGYYNLTVSAYDGHEWSSNSTSTLFTLDSSIPSVTLNKPLNGIWQSDATVVFNYTASSNNLDDCVLYGNFSGNWQANETNSTPDSGSYDLISLSLTDGVYAWNVMCNNTAGTIAWSLNNYTLNIDTTQPSFSSNKTNATASMPKISNVLQLNITVSDNFGASMIILATNQSGTLRNVSNQTFSGMQTSATAVFNLTVTMSRGLMQWQVWANDSAGNSNVSEQFSVEVKNTAPTQPTVYYPVDGKNYSSIPYINYSSTDADGDAITYKIYINNTLNITTATNVTSWNASDGNYNMTVGAWDGTGSSANSSFTVFSIDTTAPLFLNQEKNETPAINEYLRMNITIAEPNCNYYKFFWNGTNSGLTNESAESCMVGVISTTKQVVNAHRNICWDYWVNDTMGNSASSSLDCFTVANTAPTIPSIIYPVNGQIYTNVPYLNYSSTDADGDSITYYVYINSTLNITTTTNVTSWNASDGSYNLTLFVSDGLQNSSNSSYFRLDTTAPAVTSWTPSGRVTTWTFTISVTTDENATCRYVPSTEGGITTSYDNLPYNFSGNSLEHSKTLTLTDDYYEYYARCRDTLGNTMSVSTNISFTVDVETITVTVTSTTAGGGGGGGGSVVEREVNENILLDLDVPINQTLIAGDEKEVKLRLKNKGDVLLRNIKLDSDTNAPALGLELSKSMIEQLNTNEEDHISLKLKSLAEPTAKIGLGRYFVTINANASELGYGASVRFFIDLKEKDYEARIETLKQMEFVNDLFEKNPGCMEYNGKILEARGYYDIGDYEKSTSLIDSAMQSCRDLIASKEERKIWEQPAPMKGTDLIIFFIAAVIIFVVLMIMLYRYKKKRKKYGEVKAEPTLESTFKELAKETKKLLRKRELVNARDGYIKLSSLYREILDSSLPVSIKEDCYKEVIKIYSKLSKLIGKYNKARMR